MFTGGYSYLHMLQMQREEEERRRKQYGFLMPRSYMGQEVDPETSRSARAQALISFGLPLLAAGKTGDFGGALAEGVAGFQGTMDDVLAKYHREKKADEVLQHDREREAERDKQEREYRAAQMTNIEADNKRADAAAQDKVKQHDTLRQYHEELLKSKDVTPQQRKLLEPFIGGEQFDTAWMQVMKPKEESGASHASEVRLNLALEAAARAQETANYNRQRDERQDVQQAQSKWDATFNQEQKKFSDALKAGRNAGIGEPVDINNSSLGLKKAPTGQELIELERQADAMARQATEAKLGPRPAGNSANITRPANPSTNHVLTYDPATGTFK